MIDNHDKPKMELIMDLLVAINITTIYEHQLLFNQVWLLIEHQYINQEKLYRALNSLN